MNSGSKRLLGLCLASLLIVAVLSACLGPLPEPAQPVSPTVVLTATAVPQPTPTAFSDGPQRPAQGEAAEVLRVVDGDTIIVLLDGQSQRVRYIGIDAPESVKPNSPVEFMGPEASDANKALVDGQQVWLEKDVSNTDRYQRLLRYVWVGDTMVNGELVRQGYAHAVSYPPDVKHLDWLRELQAEARAAGRGLWSE